MSNPENHGVVNSGDGIPTVFSTPSGGGPGMSV